MEYWLISSPWLGILFWIILYISDYYLTIYSARGFREIGHFQFKKFNAEFNALICSVIYKSKAI